MYYMIYIDEGFLGYNKPLKFYARCNLEPEYKNKATVWTEKVSEALVSEDYKYIAEIYRKIKKEQPWRDLDILARRC